MCRRRRTGRVVQDDGSACEFRAYLVSLSSAGGWAERLLREGGGSEKRGRQGGDEKRKESTPGRWAARVDLIASLTEEVG